MGVSVATSCQTDVILFTNKEAPQADSKSVVRGCTSVIENPMITRTSVVEKITISEEKLTSFIESSTEVFSDNNVADIPEVRLDALFKLLSAKLPQNSRFTMIPDSISLELWHTDGEYVAVLDKLGEYAYGETPEAAMGELWLKLEDYYLSLRESENILSSALRSELEYLRTIMHESA